MGGTESILKIWENNGGYVGLEHRCENAPFEYRIGMFSPAGTPIPEGFDFVDFPAASLGICWIYGKENDVHNTSKCMAAVQKKGLRFGKIPTMACGRLKIAFAQDLQHRTNTAM